MQTSTQPVSVYMEENPNPNSLKFVANFMLVPEGESFDYPDKSAAQHAPLALELFNYPFVKRVFYMSNFVTVTKDEAIEWGEIRGQIRDHIKNYLEQGKAVLHKDALVEADKKVENASELEQKIINILEEYIKPAVEMDGGAISFHSFEDGKVKVLLQGSCSGCPSSTVTLKAGIENLLKRMVPEVKEVEAEGI